MTIRKIQMAVFLLLLGACSEGAEGPPGAAGPPGPSGPSGDDGINASTPTPEEAGHKDAGPTDRPTSIVWKDATGKTIPVIGMTPGVFSNQVYAFNWLNYVGDDGIVWSLFTLTGELQPVGKSELGALAYDSPDCSGPAYVFVGVPARVTFTLNHRARSSSINQAAADRAGAVGRRQR